MLALWIRLDISSRWTFMVEGVAGSNRPKAQFELEAR